MTPGSLTPALNLTPARRLTWHPQDVLACHGVGGTVGMIMTSLLSTTSVNAGGADGAFYGNWIELGKTLLVLVVVVPYFLAATSAILWFTDKLITLRVSGELQICHVGSCQ